MLFAATLAMLAISFVSGDSGPLPQVASGQLTAESISNMGFDLGAVGQSPPGWFGANLTTEVDPSQPKLRYAELKNETGKPLQFTRAIGSGAYRGRTLRLSGMIRTHIDGPGGGGLWLRVDGPDGKSIAFRNTLDRPVNSHDWSLVELEIDVPPDATRLVFGGLLSGKGTAGFRALEFSLRPEPTGPMTAAASSYLNRALDILERRHINSSTADWPALRKMAGAMASHAQEPADTYPAINYVIRALGERHTSLRRPPPKLQNDQPRRPTEEPRPLPTTDVSSRIGVLRLPYLVTLDDQSTKFASDYEAVLGNAIISGRKVNVCGWIVDLRSDGGGDMWPMVRGLAALIGEAPHPSFVHPNGSRDAWAWKAKPYGSTRPPVAVLVGPDTASSGEMTALAFIGAPNVKLFGSPTAGFTTANEPVRLSDGAVIVLTDAYVEDRNGRRVSGALEPDVQSTSDAAEDAARRWLAEMGCLP